MVPLLQSVAKTALKEGDGGGGVLHLTDFLPAAILRAKCVVDCVFCK